MKTHTHAYELIMMIKWGKIETIDCLNENGNKFNREFSLVIDAYICGVFFLCLAVKFRKKLHYKLTNCLSAFNYFVGLALKGLNTPLG